MSYIAKVDYLKISKDNMDYFFKRTYKMLKYDVDISVTRINPETYYKNLDKDNKNTNFLQIEFNKASEFFKRVISLLEKGSNRKKF